MDIARRKTIFITLILGMWLLSACRQASVRPSQDGKLRIVATTTIVGDVVWQVAADQVELSVLLPVGADPHSFDPTPQDVAKIADADLVFTNGGGLEAFLDNLIESADARDRLVSVSNGVDFLMSGGEENHEHEAEGQHELEPSGIDPHTWTDPNNVMLWVENILQTLVAQDPEFSEVYQANAEKYLAQLTALDTWIREEVALVPNEARKLVTDHTLFSYFADAYGFEQVGALIPGYSTLSEPTARELAAIEDAIEALGVKAVFVGNTVNPALAERVVADTGTLLVYVYTGSLSEADGPAGTYLTYMRYNTNAFVGALK